MSFSLGTFPIRIIAIIVAFCIAINVVLYSSAAFSTTRTNDEVDAKYALGSVSTQSPNNANKVLRTFSPRGKPHSILSRRDGESRHSLTDENEEDENGVATVVDENDKKDRNVVETLKKKNTNDNDGHKKRKTKGHHKEKGPKKRGRKRIVSRFGGNKTRKLLKKEDREEKEKDWKEGTEKQSVPMDNVLSTARISRLLVDPPKPTKTPQKTRKSKDEFDIDVVLDLLKHCSSDDNAIFIDCFNDAYEELCKLFNALGTIFSFVNSEIQEKITILRDYRKDPATSQHYLTIQTMVQYEMDHHLTIQDDKPSGSRTLLRLHRALQFISSLVEKLQDSDESKKFSEKAADAYASTLAKHHPWYVRKGVEMALYATPDRGEFLEKLSVRDSPEDMAKMKELIVRLNGIYNVTQQLYAQNHLLDLP